MEIGTRIIITSTNRKGIICGYMRDDVYMIRTEMGHYPVKRSELSVDRHYYVRNLIGSCGK